MVNSGNFPQTFRPRLRETSSAMPLLSLARIRLSKGDRGPGVQYTSIIEPVSGSLAIWTKRLRKTTAMDHGQQDKKI